MASEILGLFTTPEQYQQNQLAQARSRAFQEVQLDPFQQAALGARTAGYQFGQAVGGALGGQDPQLQRITQRQQLASQLDQSKPESYMRVAQLAAQSGDPEFAIAIADAGRQMQAGMATARKATAEAEKALLDKIKNRYDNGTKPEYAASRLWVDAIINPLDTRKWISMGIEAADHAPVEKFNVGVVQA